MPVNAPETRIVTFGSDNYAGVHPAVLEAIAAANVGFAPAYGDDAWTAALSERVRSLLGAADAEVFPVFTGTGGNVTALATVMRPFEAVICPETAHIHVDECGAAERFAGCKLLDVPAPGGKLTPALVRAAAGGVGDQHHVQPRVVAISQPTELGTVYTPDEILALAGTAHELGMLLQVDGARLPNAAVSLGLEFREFITDCGVDVLTFGGTKNGLLGGEAVVFLGPRTAEWADHYRYMRKQGMQLASKMRFVSAQLLALLDGDLWRETAGHANGMARRLADALTAIGVQIAYPVQSNGVFPVLPHAVSERLLEQYRFYPWDDEAGVVRFMCSWQTTPADVDALVAAAREALAAA